MWLLPEYISVLEAVVSQNLLGWPNAWKHKSGDIRITQSFSSRLAFKNEDSGQAIATRTKLNMVALCLTPDHEFPWLLFSLRPTL